MLFQWSSPKFFFAGVYSLFNFLLVSAQENGCLRADPLRRLARARQSPRAGPACYSHTPWLSAAIPKAGRNPCASPPSQRRQGSQGQQHEVRQMRDFVCGRSRTPAWSRERGVGGGGHEKKISPTTTDGADQISGRAKKPLPFFPCENHVEFLDLFQEETFLRQHRENSFLWGGGGRDCRPGARREGTATGTGPRSVSPGPRVPRA